MKYLILIPLFLSLAVSASGQVKQQTLDAEDQAILADFAKQVKDHKQDPPMCTTAVPLHECARTSTRLDMVLLAGMVHGVQFIVADSAAFQQELNRIVSSDQKELAVIKDGNSPEFERYILRQQAETPLVNMLGLDNFLYEINETDQNLFSRRLFIRRVWINEETVCRVPINAKILFQNQKPGGYDPDRCNSNLDQAVGVIQGYFAGTLSAQSATTWQTYIDRDSLPKGAGVLTGRNLLEECQNQTPAFQEVCAAFIAGVLDSAPAMKRNWRMPDISVGQAKDIAVQYLVAHPEAQHLDAFELVWSSWKSAFSKN